MRKLIVILVALLFINSSFGQVRLGIKAGGNLANVDGFDKSKIRIGLNAGPVLQVNLAKIFFLQSELLYSIKGNQSSVQSGDDTRLNLNYINLPVLFGYKASQNFSIKLGPEIGRLLNAKIKYDDGSSVDVSQFYRDFDLGADLGLAYSFKKVSLDLRYNYGLSHVVHIMGIDPYGTPTGQEETFGANRVLQFSLCYFLGKK